MNQVFHIKKKVFLNTTGESGESIIRPMPAELSNKIAAGEVVQRPASVAKELLDNAIDAGADHIKLIIQQAGRTLIQCVDNGCGMSPADARLCFEALASFKIQSMADLFRVLSMVTSWEACASISTLSD